MLTLTSPVNVVKQEVSIIMVAVQFSVSKIPYVTPIVFPGQNLDFPNIGIQQDLDPGSVLTVPVLHLTPSVESPSRRICVQDPCCVSRVSYLLLIDRLTV